MRRVLRLFGSEELRAKNQKANCQQKGFHFLNADRGFPGFKKTPFGEILRGPRWKFLRLDSRAFSLLYRYA
jgi:hypothetical protein